jgi:hypothetical protein
VSGVKEASPAVAVANRLDLLKLGEVPEPADDGAG